ncbi:MAG: FkbM family methyltransferase [Verrucomicrobiota bacterium]
MNVSSSSYEPHVIKAITRLTRKGFIAYDVGANVGVFTEIFIELVGDTGEVHAFEPTTFNIERLNKKFASYPNVHIHSCAVSNTDLDEMPFYVDMHEEKGQVTGVYSSLFDLPDPEKRQMKKRFVSTISLDSHCKKYRPPGILKIDVEGAEPLVIFGGKEMISQHRPYIIMEFWEWSWDAGFREAVSWLDSINYRMIRLDDGKSISANFYDTAKKEKTVYLLAKPGK